MYGGFEFAEWLYDKHSKIANIIGIVSYSV